VKVKVREIFNNYSKIIVWGTGNYYFKFKSNLPDQIDYFIDNNEKKWQTILDGKRIEPPLMLRDEKAESTLIVVCNNYYDEIIIQLNGYGNFDAIDIVNIAMVEAHEENMSGVLNNEQSNKPKILICAGIHALWQRNGARRFIEGQIDTLQKYGYQTIEIAPLMYLENSENKEDYLIVNENRSYIGLFSIKKFIRAYPYHSVIIHSLYYNYTILEPLLANKDFQGKSFYYLHDYFILCRNRFLFYNHKLCLNDKDVLQCDECSEYEESTKIQYFHRELYTKYDIIFISPSLDVKQRIGKVYHGIPIKVLPHLSYQEEVFEREKHEKLRIAFLGVAMWQKGWDEFCEIVENNYEKYEFFCMGDCEKSKRMEHIEYHSIELDSKECLTMPQALQKYEIDIAYVGSILPETYSYTYYEAYEAGCFVITTSRSGNICMQVEINKNGKVFDSTNEINLWLSDSEKVKKDVESMKKKIVLVTNNDKFIDLLIK
jgi:hypothetical protein